jgi:hypothetical protein
MDPNEIIQIIRRRQTRFHPSRSGSQEPIDESSRLIVEEYDSLLAEIEACQKPGAAMVPAHDSGGESPNQAAEAEILGDQGQSGG